MNAHPGKHRAKLCFHNVSLFVQYKKQYITHLLLSRLSTQEIIIQTNIFPQESNVLHACFLIIRLPTQENIMGSNVSSFVQYEKKNILNVLHNHLTREASWGAMFSSLAIIPYRVTSTMYG